MSVEFDFRNVDLGFQNLARASGNLRSVFSELRTDVRDDMKEHFSEKRGPDGEAWAPWSASYQEKVLSTRNTRGLHRYVTKKGQLKKSGARKLDNPLGRLKNAFVYKATDKYIEVRSRIHWAAVHEDGGGAGHGAQIPARPFMYFGERVVELAKKRVADFVARAW